VAKPLVVESKPDLPWAITHRLNAATTAAATCVTTYAGTSRQSNRRPIARPTEIAGLKWPPEM
jgi:hypothetical protein